VGVPLSSSFRRRPESTFSAADAPEGTWIPDQVRNDGEWEQAIAAFGSAQAAVAAVERATAGRSVEEEEAWLPRYDAACEAMAAALARAIAAPAPDLAALAVKLELVFAHEMEPGALDQISIDLILSDAWRLASA
jgi:hypothetical protein